MKNTELLETVYSSLSASFNGLITDIYLFGSRADGTAIKHSDYDILVLLARNITWQEKDRIIDVISEINIAHDIIIDIHLIPKDDLTTVRGKQPYIQNALQSGIAL